VSVGKSSPLRSPSQSLLIGPFRIRVSAQAAANRLVFTNFKKSFLELFRFPFWCTRWLEGLPIHPRGSVNWEFTLNSTEASAAGEISRIL
jgi:hypothetical protein